MLRAVGIGLLFPGAFCVVVVPIDCFQAGRASILCRKRIVNAYVENVVGHPTSRL